MAIYPEAQDFYNIPKYLPYISLEMMRDLSNTFPSNFVLQPTWLNDTEILISASVGGRNAAYTKHDIASALEVAGLSEAKRAYEASSSRYSFHQLGDPQVPVNCVFGTGDKTIRSISFGDGFGKPATGYVYEDGDGMAPVRSLSLCAQWEGATAHGLPHAGHGGTCHTPAAVDTFSQIVRSLYAPRSTRQSKLGSVMV